MQHRRGTKCINSRPDPNVRFEMSDFFYMGGYGVYVWGSYGVCAAALALEVVLVLRKKREAKT